MTMCLDSSTGPKQTASWQISRNGCRSSGWSCTQTKRAGLSSGTLPNKTGTNEEKARPRRLIFWDSRTSARRASCGSAACGDPCGGYRATDIPTATVAELNDDYIANMEDVLETYEQPYDPKQPVVCLDEKPVTLHADVRPASPAAPGREARRDNEYERCGPANVFCAVEPKPSRHFTFPTPDRSAF